MSKRKKDKWIVLQTQHAKLYVTEEPNNKNSVKTSSNTKNNAKSLLNVYNDDMKAHGIKKGEDFLNKENLTVQVVKNVLTKSHITSNIQTNKLKKKKKKSKLVSNKRTRPERLPLNDNDFKRKQPRTLARASIKEKARWRQFNDIVYASGIISTKVLSTETGLSEIVLKQIIDKKYIPTKKQIKRIMKLKRLKKNLHSCYHYFDGAELKGANLRDAKEKNLQSCYNYCDSFNKETGTFEKEIKKVKKKPSKKFRKSRKRKKSKKQKL